MYFTSSNSSLHLVLPLFSRVLHHCRLQAILIIPSAAIWQGYPALVLLFSFCCFGFLASIEQTYHALSFSSELWGDRTSSLQPSWMPLSYILLLPQQGDCLISLTKCVSSLVSMLMETFEPISCPSPHTFVSASLFVFDCTAWIMSFSVIHLVVTELSFVRGGIASLASAVFSSNLFSPSALSSFCLFFPLGSCYWHILLTSGKPWVVMSVRL